MMHLRICYVNTGTVKESGEKHKGSVEIPNLSEENEVDDTEVGVQHWYGCTGPQFLNEVNQHLGIIF